jgi:hypothetical protein
LSQRPSPVSIQIHTAPVAAVSTGAIAGMVGAGVVLGIALGYLAHRALPEKPPSAPIRAGSTPVLAMGGSASWPGARHASAQLPPSIDVADLPEELPAPSPPGNRPTPPGSPPKASPAVAPRMRVERARAFFKTGDVQAALALLTPRAGHSPEGADGESQRKLLKTVCAAPAARDARECADEKTGSALE